MTQTATQRCPKCHADIPVDPGYPVWCGLCEWNLFAHEWGTGRPKSRFQQFYLDVSDRIARRQLTKIVSAGLAPRPLRFPKLLAIIIASLVHVFVLVVAIYGISLVAGSYNSNGLTLMVGIMLVVIAFRMRPPVAPVPRYNIVSRRAFPTLYDLTDDIASRLGTRHVDAILVSTQFNASFFRAGWSRKNILHLGMSLFEILTPQERVALIAHELAHSANGDAARSFYIASAIRSLRVWYRSFMLDDQIGYVAPFAILIMGLARLAAIIPASVATILVLLLANDSQRGEYLADSMAARAGGTQAALAMLRKLHMRYALQTAIDRHYEMGAKQGVFEALRRKVEHVPPREIERVARMDRLLESGLGVSHPPTAYRIELLKARPVAEPEVILSAEDIAEIERELSQIMPDLETIMLENYRSRTNH